MQISRSFPNYENFSPRVPVWCVTPERPACIHRFFDTSPISPSGRYVALFQLPAEDSVPAPGDAGNIVLVDLATGEDRVVAETCGWETQVGANINWGGSDHELYFNDVDIKDWRPFAWKLDPLTGQRQPMEGTVYHASPDGRWLVSANLTTSRRTQPGYGVVVPDELVRRNIGPAEDDGFYLTDTTTGRGRLLASISQLLAEADPAVGVEAPAEREIYGFHSKFSPQGDWLMLSLRWYPVPYPVPDEPVFDPYAANLPVRFAWVTMPLSGRPKHCAIGPDEWDKGGHHATWFPDGKRISMNLNIDMGDVQRVEDVMRFVQVNADGSGLRKMRDDVIGGGHPTVHPDGRHILTDTYTWDEEAFGDGTIPLRWIDLESGEEEVLVRINTQQPYGDSDLRVDPHPAWDRTWRYVTFNGFVDGTRRVFIADMAEIL